MGKTLKTVGAVVGGAVLIATGVGALAGLNVAAMGISTLTGSLTVGQLGTLASGLAAVGSALDKPKSSGAGNPSDWTSNPDQPVPFLFGEMGIAGKIVHRDEFGPDDNMYQGIIGVLSGAGPIKSVLAFKGDDQPVLFDALTGKATTSQWKDEMWMRYRLGNQPDSALNSPPGLKGNAQMPSWGGSHRLSGKACYMQVLGENSKRSAYPNGEPVPQHQCEGIFGWDGRYDDTWPGGMGPCRFGVRSTYRYITDPIIAGLNWSLGLVENGKVVGGIGASRDGVDIDSFLQAANVSEANGWIISAWPDTSEDVSQVLNQMLQAGGATRARNAGRISCVTRGAVLPSVVTVTADDLAGPIELDTGASLFNRLTTITPKFMSADAGWQAVAGTPVRFQSLIEEDGIETADQIDYRFVPRAKQAAELAALDILDAREPFSGTVPLKPSMRRLKPGSRFTIDAPGLLLDGVKCMVLGRSYTAQTGESRIAFRSETDGKVDLALGKTTSLPTFPNLRPPNPLEVTPPLPTDWAIIPREPTEEGVQLPIWDLVGAVSNANVTGMIVEWGLEPSPPPPDPIPIAGPGETQLVFADYIAWNEAFYGSPTATRIAIQGMQPGGTYYVSVRHLRGSSYSARTLYGPEVVPSLIALSEADNAALDRIAEIESDNLLARGEKPELLRIYQAIVAEQPGISAQALALGATAQRTNYNNAFTEVGNYLTSLSPSWSDLTVDTPISGVELRLRLLAYYTAKEVLRTANLAIVETIADQAALDAASALSRIGVIDSDAILSRGEKPELIRIWSALDAERPGIRAQALATAGVTAALDAYDAAYTSLANYLGSLSPQWNNASVDTPLAVASPTFAQRFTNFYVAKQALLNAMLGVAGSDAQLALGRIDIIRSDAWLSRGEKPFIVSQWQSIEAEYPSLSAQALAVGATTERNNLIAARNALATYLAGLSPAFTDTTQDTAIVPATFAQKFADYYAARASAQAETIAAVNEDAQAALTRIAAIDSDAVLSRGEKAEIVRIVAAIQAEYAPLQAQALAIGDGPHRDAYSTAYGTLINYLNGLSPNWNDTAQDTTIVPATFNARFTDYYVAADAVRNRMVGQVGQSAADSLAAIARIQSDNWLTAGEKPEIIRQYGLISAEYASISAQALALGATSARTAFVSAFDTLTSYLGGLSPAWNSTTTDTVIDGPTFTARFTAYYTARESVRNATLAIVGTDAANALSRLAAIDSDGILSRNEKPELMQRHAAIVAEYPGLSAQALSIGATAQRTALINAYTEVNNYLGTLSPAWNNTSADTPISASELSLRFANYFAAKQSVINAMIGIVYTDAQSALSRLAVIDSDGILSRGEKPDLIALYASFVAEQPGLSAQGLTTGATAQRTAYNNAFNAITGYLNSLSPAWNDTSQDTPITVASPTFQQRFTEYYATRQALINAMINIVGTEARAALDRLAIIASDSVLSREEKPELIRLRAGLLAEYNGLLVQALAVGATAQRTAYIDAFAALDAYLGSLSPAWNDIGTDTPIVSATLTARFETLYAARQAVVNAMIGLVYTDTQTALARLAIIDSDSVLSRGEKPEVMRLHASLAGEYTGLLAQALAIGATSQRTAYINAFSALDGYLNGLSPAWNNTAADTPIVASTLSARFEAVYSTRQAIMNAMFALIDADAQAALDRLAAIDSDAILSRNEKPEIIRLYAGFAAEQPGLSAQGLTTGATAQRTAYNNAFTGITNYLGILNPAWNNTAFDSPIVIASPTFQQRFTDYYATRQALINAMVNIVGTDSQTALARIATIQSDSILSRGEKPEVVRQWQTISGEYPGLSARALSVGATSQRTTLINAYNALATYLGGLSPLWHDYTSDTPIDSNFYTVFSNYYTAKQAVVDAMIGLLDAETNALLNDLANIQSDGVLSRGEKPAVIEKWQVISGEYTPLVNRLTTAGSALDAVRIDYQNRYTEVANYLGSLSPAWNNAAFDTPISATTLRDRFANYYIAKQAAMNALTATAGGMKVSASSLGVGRNVSSPGNYTTTSAISLTVTGGSGTYTYEWGLLSSQSSNGGAHVADITGSDGTGCAFNATVTFGETVSGSFACLVRDTGTGETFTSVHTGRITEIS